MRATYLKESTSDIRPDTLQQASWDPEFAAPSSAPLTIMDLAIIHAVVDAVRMPTTGPGYRTYRRSMNL